ncbi:hypothetical protein AB9M62_24590 [Bacillales bacterium AN1005]
MTKIIPFKPRYQFVEFGNPKEKLDAKTKELYKEYEALKSRSEERKKALKFSKE